jgi:3-oxoadipate enol-lactonase
MGGKVTQLIASRHPTGLEGIVLLAPAPPTPLILPTEEMRQQQLHAYSSPESAEFVVRNVLTSSRISDEDVAALVNDCRSGTESATAAWPKYAQAEDISELVEEVDVPILILVGENDKVEPLGRVMEEVASRLQGARLFVIEGVGHMLPIEAPKRLADEITGFIESLNSWGSLAKVQKSTVLDQIRFP